MKKGALLSAVLLVAPVLASAAAASTGVTPVTVTVDGGTILNPGSSNGLGINTDYWWDDQANRPSGARPLSAALRDMNVSFARYPGGEEADGYLWSQPPYITPAPHLARVSSGDWPSNDPSYWTPPASAKGDWAHAIYDFDEFMSDCRAVGCQPVLVVAEDGIYKPAAPGGTSLTKPQALEAAAAWVRYANVVKGYGIKYWEIGNETWLDTYMGANPGPVTYGKDVAEFSRVMKAVDPSIQIGANGNTRAWFAGVLSQAAADIDFLAVHSYPSYGMSFSTYQRSVLPTRTETDNATDALASFPVHKDRIFIAVTETGVLDAANDLGSAMMNFTAIGDLLADKRVRFSMMWTTRWVDTGSPSATDALDASNNLYPMGRAVAIWGTYKRGRMVAATSNNAAVQSYASQDPLTRQVSVFVVNKSGGRLAANVILRRAGALTSVTRWVLKGTGPTDPKPTFTPVAALRVSSGKVDMSLDPYSVTVLTGVAT